jgi:hypothetical protein
MRPLAIGLILFGFLAIGGTIDGARRKLLAQPDWVALNWRTVVRGMTGWCLVGGLALIGGIVGLLL